jgi:hypothetical protein
MTINEDATLLSLDEIKALFESGKTKEARIGILNASRAEGTAKKDAQKAGTEVPATPVTDWSKSPEYAAARQSVRGGRPPAPKTERVAVQYYRDGKPITNPSVNSLSGVAFTYCKGVDGKPRVSVKRLIEVLAELGVGNPRSEAFDVQLPGGMRISATVGSLVPHQPKATTSEAAATAAAKGAKATPAKKAPATKATAKKAPAAKKPPARRPARPVTKASQTRNNGKASTKVA